MKKIFAQIAAIWHMLLGQTDKALLKYLDEAVAAATILKNILANPIVAAAIQFTPTKADDKARERILNIVEKVLLQMVPAQECMAHADQQERIACLLNRVKEFFGNKEVPGGFIRDFASKYLQLNAPKEMHLEDHVANAIVENKVFAMIVEKKEGKQ